MDPWNVSGIGQVMVERVGLDAIDNYGVADLNGDASQPFSSLILFGILEKPSSKYASSNLAMLGQYIAPSRVLNSLETTVAGVVCEKHLTYALDEF